MPRRVFIWCHRRGQPTAAVFGMSPEKAGSHREKRRRLPALGVILGRRVEDLSTPPGMQRCSFSGAAEAKAGGARKGAKCPLPSSEWRDQQMPGTRPSMTEESVTGHGTPLKCRRSPALGVILGQRAENLSTPPGMQRSGSSGSCKGMPQWHQVSIQLERMDRQADAWHKTEHDVGERSHRRRPIEMAPPPHPRFRQKTGTAGAVPVKLG